jgi:hypothetical protein
MPSCNTGRNIQKYKGVAASTLQDVTDNGNTTTGDIITTSGFFIGDGSKLTGISGTSSAFSFQETSDTGNTTSNTIQFTNTNTSLTTSGNVIVAGNVSASIFYGDGGALSNISVGSASGNLQSVTNNGATTTNKITFSNSVTSLETSGNVIVAGNVTASNFYGDYITHTDDSSAYFGFPFDDTFTITTSNTERFRINSIGGVVIGTTTTGYSLDVNGHMNISGGLRANGSLGTSGQVLTSSGGGAMSWTTVSGGGSSPWTTSVSDIYRSSGKVGIGTSSPGAPLEIRSSGSANPFDNGLLVYNTAESSNQDSIITLRVGGSNAGDPFISFDVAGEAGWAFGMDNNDSNKLKWSTNAGNLTNTKMTLTDDGKLGIGTSSPAYPLDVTGNMNISGGLRANGAAGSNGQVLTSSGGGAMSWTTVSGGGSSPWTTSVSDIYRSSGKVGIGTTTPAYPLDVVGTVNATSFRGDGTNLTNITAGSITSEASRTIQISTIQVQGGSWDVR